MDLEMFGCAAFLAIRRFFSKFRRKFSPGFHRNLLHLRLLAAVHIPGHKVRLEEVQSLDFCLRLRMFYGVYNSEVRIRRAEFAFYCQRLIRSGRQRASVKVIETLQPVNRGLDRDVESDLSHGAFYIARSRRAAGQQNRAETRLNRVLGNPYH